MEMFFCREVSHANRFQILHSNSPPPFSPFERETLFVSLVHHYLLKNMTCDMLSFLSSTIVYIYTLEK